MEIEYLARSGTGMAAGRGAEFARSANGLFGRHRPGWPHHHQLTLSLDRRVVHGPSNDLGPDPPRIPERNRQAWDQGTDAAV